MTTSPAIQALIAAHLDQALATLRDSLNHLDDESVRLLLADLNIRIQTGPPEARYRAALAQVGLLAGIVSACQDREGQP